MGFLDQKETILDIVLTDKGRELLSKNQLNFTYFAFSDEGVDYSGSMAEAEALGVSLDDYLHRNLSFEADSRSQNVPPGDGGFLNESSRTRHRDMGSFLYTIPAEQKTLPRFEINAPDGQEIILRRRYEINTIILNERGHKFKEKPVDVVVRASKPKTTKKERKENYVSQQRFRTAFNLLTAVPALRRLK